MKFSVIIPTYKRHEDLFRCLSCLEPYFKEPPTAFEVEVIVSDDAREPSLKAKLADKFPWCRYLDGPSRGPAANRNNAAKAASGDWLVFTDDDCLPQIEWLEEFAAHSAQAEVLEGKTTADRPRRRLDEESPINETGGYLWSCNLAVKKSVFERLDGFDETFPYAAMEDVDFRIRLEKESISSVFLPNAVVIHPWRRAKRSFFDKKYRSWLHLVGKHTELSVPDRKELIGRLFKTLIQVFRDAFHYGISGIDYHVEHIRHIFLLIVSIRYRMTGTRK